jgi:hypothetical protein
MACSAAVIASALSGVAAIPLRVTFHVIARLDLRQASATDDTRGCVDRSQPSVRGLTPRVTDTDSIVRRGGEYNCAVAKSQHAGVPLLQLHTGKVAEVPCNLTHSRHPPSHLGSR